MIYWILVVWPVIAIYGIAIFGTIIVLAYLSRGHDKFKITLTKWKEQDIQDAIVKFFEYREIRVSRNGTQIIASDGSRFWTGERVFIFTFQPSAEGTVMDCDFFVRSMWPYPDTPFSKISYFAFIPRRRGWNVKMQLFEKFDIDPHHLRV